MTGGKLLTGTILRPVATVFLLACFTLPTGISAQQRGWLEDERIELIRDQLRSERRRLDSLTLVKRTELEQLNSIDEQIQLNSELLVRLNRRLRALEAQERELSLEASQLDSLLASRKVRLSVSLRNFYLKRRRIPEISLTSNDFARAISQIVYARESLKSLKRVISETDSLLGLTSNKSKALEITRAEIDYHCTEIDIEKELLQSERERRDRLMNRIRGEEYLYREHLRQLEADAGSDDSSITSNDTDESRSLFEYQKGRLPFPLHGEIIKSFGKILDGETQTEVVSPGIEIGGNAGSDIRAVYDGVVFHRGALRGYGRVLVLDHGNGWYTLYGRLSDYTVNLGQSVRTGDIIGYLDDSSTNSVPSLHFEIRHRKQQYDPVEWLRLD